MTEPNIGPGVHPDLVKVLTAVAALGVKPIQVLDPVAARQQMEWTVAQRRVPPVEVGAVLDRTIPGPGGDIAVRVYRPVGSGDAVLPALLYFHGGGHVIGSLTTHDGVGRSLCALAGCLVLSVDYRMGPEHRFPAAVEDAWAALAWLAQHGAEIGADTTRLAVGGDSAGGNLATVLALMARDAGGPALRHQLLIYPLVDYRCASPSYERYATGYGLLEADTMVWFRDHYLRDIADADDWRASPLLASDHTNLPPAHVVVAECDVLHDEVVAYAERLTSAGVAVDVVTYPGMVHAFFPMTVAVAGADEANARAAVALRQALMA
ncbi:MAG: alpha/beta hydrolase [Alphaproteobacteria bacterium]|nr:alpha/beta hydrolase [Alphaproteobacteria bacterium]